MNFKQLNHIVPVYAPVADFGDGGFNTDIVSMKNTEHCAFLVVMGANAGGALTFTVDACSTVGAAATTQIPFYYSSLQGTADPVTTDVWTDVAYQATAATGVLMTTAAYQTYLIEVNASMVMNAGYEFVRLTAAETTNAAITGGVYAILSGLRHAGDDLQSAIV